MQSTSLCNPTNFILDFDGTITTKDTISTLAKIGIARQKIRGKDLTAAWDEIVALYIEDSSTHNASYGPKKENRKSLAQEIAYYRSLREVELESFERVSKSGLFRGISEDEWKRAAIDAIESGEVVMRAGLKEFMLDLRRRGGKCGVVSVNFSSHFIRGVLEANGLETFDMEILANLPDENGVLFGPRVQVDGEVRPVMATSDAKLSWMKYLLSSWAVGNYERSMLSPGNSVYIGDSGTDIECLAAPNLIGVIIAENGESSLMETLQRVELQSDHVQDYWEGNENRLYWANDFQDILNSPLSVTSSIKNV